MSRAKGNKLYANFSRGLITEASELAFPEDATTDELNCDIQENGVRVRRYGYNTNGTFTDLTLSSFSNGDSYHNYVWRSVAKDGSLNFLVVQIENTIHFWVLTAGSTGTKKSFTIDLTTYLAGTGTADDLKSEYCQFASGRGELFIAHRNITPIRVEYDSGGDSITVSEIKILVRDFVGLDDSLAVDEEPATLSTEHHYNLRNQGWIDPENTGTGTAITSYSLFNRSYSRNYPTTTGPIAEYFTSESRYPGNNKIWWSSKDANGDFDPAGLGKIFFGNTRAPRGHFILEAFNKDRSAVSGVSGITAETEAERPRAVEFASGRVFWGHKSDVYFSPILEDGSRAGQCFQEADPTSENISDLIATDGGLIPLPDAEQIVRLVSMGNGVMVFASNGIWFIAEGQQGFSPLDYSITKVSDVGTLNARSIVRAGSAIYWWSETGIHGMRQSIGQFGPIAGQFEDNNMTDDTIKTFYNNINEDARQDCVGEYDPASKKIVWLYKDNGEPNSQQENLLWYDMRNQAFVPWKVEERNIAASPTSGNHYIVGVFRSPYFATNTEEPSFFEFPMFAMEGTGAAPVQKIKLGNFVNQNYVDWEALTFGGSTNKATYESYLLTGYEMLGDGMRRKQAPHVGIFFKRTEDTVTDEGGGEYSIDNESSCTFQARWDWSNRSDGRWSREVQVYRPQAIPFIDPLAPSANPGVDVVFTKTKVRGSGRTLQFKFSESGEGKGFELLGWQVFYETKTNP